MNTKIILAGIGAVLAFDTAASLASRALGFSYSLATFGSYAIYFAIGFLAARAAPSAPYAAAMITAGIAGLADASAGWWVSWQVGPGKPAPDFVLTPGRWVATAIIVVGLAGTIGAVGGIAARWRP